MPIEEAVKNFGNRSLLLVAAEDNKESAETVRKLKQVNENTKRKFIRKADTAREFCGESRVRKFA
ncbi:MAG: hypothetical protein HC846_09745 [Blastocatellia bacterium]|nr:hypothetical protein [Blastocatellia bacterium]